MEDIKKRKISKKERQEAKEYIKRMLPQYLEREGINPSRNFRCLNPNHDDAHGDMSYHRPSNTCVCHCGAHYDTFDLIGIEYGLTDFNEKFERGCEIFGLLGKSDSDENLKIPVNWRESVPEYKLPERASDEQCSMAYFAVTKSKHAKLKDEHKADLLRRGFTEDDIKRFRFCSAPDSKKTAKQIASDVVEKKGFILNKVPGFYLEQSWNMVSDTKGYYIPVFQGEKNQILGFLIHADDPTKKGKYVYFSSPNKECGASSGAIPTILPGKDDRIWIVTEGVLKALCIYCLLDKEVSVIGVPGVGTLGGLNSYLDERQGADLFFFEAYDMDKIDKNKAVKQAQEKLIDSITKRGFGCHTLTWDMCDGKWQGNLKGLDDFLLDYTKSNKRGKERFLRYLRKTADAEKKTRE